MTLTRLESALIDFIYMFDGPMRTSARAAARRIYAGRSPFEEPGFFGHPHYDGKNMVAYAAATNKVFWLRLAAEEDIIVHFLEENCTNHRFKKKELIPLLQHPNPGVKMLGLKLMAGTLPDAKPKAAPVRVSRR